VPDVPPLIENSRWPEATDNPLADGEQLAVAVSVDQAPRFWTIATRKGYVQRFVRAALEREMDAGDPLLQSLLERDEATAVVNGDRGDLLVLTRWGQTNRFAHRTIEVQGSIALDLEPGDEVVDAITLSNDREVLIVASNGRVMRRDTQQLPARAKPGDTMGKRMIQNQDTRAIFEYNPHDWLLFLTASGQLHMAATTDIPLLDRLGKGTQVCDLEHDPAIAIAIIPKDLA
jgi:DNA gyrase/topoisomerase IV subunit A